jgi:large subunit ribosomal protein L29
MAIMRLKEIIAMTQQDRAVKLYDLQAELARIRTMINAGGAVDNPTRVRQLRKIIAQIKTIQNEENLGIRKAAAQPAPEKKAEKPAKKAAAKKKETEEKTSQ